MFNKRGQGLQVNTVILIILALLVLVILAFAVTGNFGQLMEKLGFIQRTSVSLEDARLQCATWCNSPSEVVQQKFCTKTQKIDSDGDPNTAADEYYCGPGSKKVLIALDLGVQCIDLDCNA